MRLWQAEKKVFYIETGSFVGAKAKETGDGEQENRLNFRKNEEPSERETLPLKEYAK